MAVAPGIIGLDACETARRGFRSNARKALIPRSHWSWVHILVIGLMSCSRKTVVVVLRVAGDDAGERMKNIRESG